ncbi:unnamed protein product [Ilex paraguariensis]|uniref:Uncharacterized protein n=1 Tax=Ilex paraguariensis TaxID=185542 RepID=A0ABC8S1I5_9AQUA
MYSPFTSLSSVGTYTVRARTYAAVVINTFLRYTELMGNLKCFGSKEVDDEEKIGFVPEMHLSTTKTVTLKLEEGDEVTYARASEQSSVSLSLSFPLIRLMRDNVDDEKQVNVGMKSVC